MALDCGLDIQISWQPMEFRYGLDVFGPEAELRRLDAIRPSLMNPHCSGPDPVYAIAMDVGRRGDEAELHKRQLLFGVVAYAAGRLGDEPVRSQGHVHKIASHSGWSAPEIFEIWQGRAVIYMQERAEDDPGKCIALEAGQGERVVVPPAWAHAVISVDSENPLVFGAWCDRDYGFEYAQIRQRGGLAWFPTIASGRIEWNRNSNYMSRDLIVRTARAYPKLGLSDAQPLYAHIATPESIQWVSKPGMLSDFWREFEP